MASVTGAAMSSISGKSVNSNSQKTVNGSTFGKIGLVDYDSDNESVEKQIYSEETGKTEAKQSIQMHLF